MSPWVKREIFSPEGIPSRSFGLRSMLTSAAVIVHVVALIGEPNDRLGHGFATHGAEDGRRLVFGLRGFGRKNVRMRVPLILRNDNSAGCLGFQDACATNPSEYQQCRLSRFSGCVCHKSLGITTVQVVWVYPE